MPYPKATTHCGHTHTHTHTHAHLDIYGSLDGVEDHTQ